MKIESILVPELDEQVSAVFERPEKVFATIVLAHGAGAGMNHPSMSKLAKALQDKGLATLRFNFPYMERGSKRPDSPKVATATIAAAVNAAETFGLPVFAGGRSFGGRMTTNAASLGMLETIRGVICFGFPLHPAKEPATSRAEHLAKVSSPMLFIQGTRDDLADLQLIKQVATAFSTKLKLHVIEGADHSFNVLKSSGRSPQQVLDEAAKAAHDFCVAHSIDR